MGNILSIERKYTEVYVHYKNFWTNYELVETVLRWEIGDNINMIINGKNVSGTLNKGLHKGKPLFEILNLDKNFEEGGTCVSKSDCGRYLAILPAHNGSLNDPKTPYNLQHIKTKISPRGIQCPCHVLIIQNPNHPDYNRPEYYNESTLNRKYNIITLMKKDLHELNNISEFREKVQNSLLNGPVDMIGSLRWWFDRKEEIILPDGTSVSGELTEYDFIPEHKHLFHKIKNGHIDEVIDYCMENKYGSYHIYDNMSIGWLHEHGNIPFHTINYQIMEEEKKNVNEIKNVNVQIIRQFINEGIPNKLYEKYLNQKNEYIKQYSSPILNNSESIYN